MVGNGATRSAERVRRSDGAAGDDDGAATWRRITRVVGQLANNTPPGPVRWSARVRQSPARATEPRLGSFDVGRCADRPRGVIAKQWEGRLF